jgi:uridine kinase
MKEIVDAATPFYRHEARSQDAIELLHRLGYEDKAKLLETSGETYISYYTLGGTVDYYYDTLLPSADYLTVWSLTPYRGGMLLRIPNRHKPEELAPYVDQPKTFEVFKENKRWNQIMGLGTVGDVNVACQGGHAADLIQISEALQEKKIVQIAEEIDRRFHSAHPVRLVLITGPSSSGKSTFCRRLSIQLKACGLHPEFFSTDDYFVNRVETPKFPDGSYDFDNFDTVDHEYLQQDVIKLLEGEEVSIPTYNFVTGLREYNNRVLKLGKDSILLVEGIHALNPQLTDMIPEDSKFRIFINTITSLSLDDHNFIPTSDIRLLRRIVRDYNKGAFSAIETICQWPKVRGSESIWIYPYQEEADVLFNSSYLIEFAVLRNNAQIILSTVPKNCDEYSEAHRLLKFLSYFTPVPDKEIPPTSLLREFVGGSSFKY